MNRTKWAVLAITAVAIGAGIFAVKEFSRIGRAHAEAATLDDQARELASKIAAVEKRLADEIKRATAAESDRKLLAETLAQVQATEREKAAKAEVPMTRQEVEARIQQATLLARNGDPAEALRELLWCWDEGSRRLGASPTRPVSTMQVIRALGELAGRYPAAMAVMEERRESLRQRVLAGPGGSDVISELTALLTGLKDTQTVVELYDLLPGGDRVDRRKQTLAIYGFEPLLEARRYTELLSGRDSESMLGSFEIESQERALPAGVPNPERLRQTMKASTVTRTVKNIEVLAGSGDLANARRLADRLLAYDNTEETKALIEQHAARAGHPGLLLSLRANP